jgi:hypothetical protein
VIGYVIYSGSLSALLIWVSRSSFCDSSFDLNVSSECRGKVFAFSLSLRAQVWSALLIGGMRYVFLPACEEIDKAIFGSAATGEFMKVPLLNNAVDRPRRCSKTLNLMNKKKRILLK